MLHVAHLLTWLSNYPIKCGMKLLIHSQTSQHLKYGDESVISFYTLLYLQLRIHAWILVIFMMPQCLRADCIVRLHDPS